MPSDLALRLVPDELSEIAEPLIPETARALLDAATSRLNGKKVAATTARKHRMLPANAMDYAAELKLLDGNPIRDAGVPAPQVAEWAGHSVEVLLKIYAKCIVGQDEAAKRRISDALSGQ